MIYFGLFSEKEALWPHNKNIAQTKVRFGLTVDSFVVYCQHVLSADRKKEFGLKVDVSDRLMFRSFHPLVLYELLLKSYFYEIINCT